MTTTTPKRKAVDQVNYDFSDFSLSASPATKIRRLDHGELAPIMEEDEHGEEEESHMSCSCSSSPFIQQETNIAAAAAAAAAREVENEERAIVLFNPKPNLSFDSSPHTFSLTPHMLSSLKGQQRLWSEQSNLLNHSDFKEEDNDVVVSNQCLAVIPWVHSHLSPPPPPPPLEDAPDTMMMMMEAQQLNEQDFAASMDIEPPPLETLVGSHQWLLQQQQHCMVPSQLLLPHNAASSSSSTSSSATATAPTPTPVWFH